MSVICSSLRVLPTPYYSILKPAQAAVKRGLLTRRRRLNVGVGLDKVQRFFVSNLSFQPGQSGVTTKHLANLLTRPLCFVRDLFDLRVGLFIGHGEVFFIRDVI